MGIRYYGWALSPEEVTQAMDDPMPLIQRADRRYRQPGWTNPDFDKAWPLMQQLFSPGWPQIPRPGYELVAGNVKYLPDDLYAYEPHVGLLAPDRVPAIARDVASVSPADVRELCVGLCYDDERRRQDDVEYVTYYLAEAQSFTADAAARGHGIVYMIR